MLELVGDVGIGTEVDTGVAEKDAEPVEVTFCAATALAAMRPVSKPHIMAKVSLLRV